MNSGTGPVFPGRGEFIRLALEEAGVPYFDMALMEGGDEKMMARMKAEKQTPSFAPPFLIAGKLTIGQTANILLFLGEAPWTRPEDRRRPLLGASVAADHRRRRRGES